jgi:hypothetical protein
VIERDRGVVYVSVLPWIILTVEGLPFFLGGSGEERKFAKVKI